VRKWHRKILRLRRGRKIGREETLDMKTKTLIACLATGLLTLGQPARAVGTRTTTPSHTASFESRHHARQAARPATLSQPGVSGVIPRAIRGGNPLQMLNPFAPAKYGTAEENVVFDPDVPGKANGISLFTVSF
jgi:hypothetical protein